jgi:hypothetical protein
MGNSWISSAGKFHGGLAPAAHIPRSLGLAYASGISPESVANLNNHLLTGMKFVLPSVTLLPVKVISGRIINAVFYPGAGCFCLGR